MNKIYKNSPDLLIYNYRYQEKGVTHNGYIKIKMARKTQKIKKSKNIKKY